MSINQIISEARLKFQDAVTNSLEYVLILRRFAKEELKLPEKEALYFSTYTEILKDDHNSEQSRAFFIWYYIHYVQSKNGAQLYNAEVHPTSVKPFTRTEIRAVKLTVENNEITVASCDPDDADFWSVYIRLTDHRALCVADCTSQDAAQNMETFIHEIAKYALLTQ